MSRHALVPTGRHLAVAVVALCVATAIFGTAASAGVTTSGVGDEVDSGEPTEGTANATATESSTLVVAVADSGERLLEVPVEDGEEVVLTYTHSVEKTPVDDVYVIGEDELRMDRTVFSSYGAGLPSEADVEVTEDGFVVSVDRSFERVYVSPGSIAGHELIVGDERYDLVERSDGSDVALFVENDRTCEPRTNSVESDTP